MAPLKTGKILLSQDFMDHYSLPTLLHNGTKQWDKRKICCDNHGN